MDHALTTTFGEYNSFGLASQSSQFQLAEREAFAVKVGKTVVITHSRGGAARFFLDTRAISPCPSALLTDQLFAYSGTDLRGLRRCSTPHGTTFASTHVVNVRRERISLQPF